MVGGKPPDEDVCISILWLSMDPTTRAHVTGKVDMESVAFSELRQIVQSYTNLIGSTTNSGRGGGVVAMDIGSIATVGDSSSEWPREWAQHAGGSVHPDGPAQQEEAQIPQPLSSLTCDESGWPVDEEGWRLQGQMIELNGQVNFVKGKGKGKGCFDCGESGHYARECPRPPKGKSKGKGKSDDRSCYNCGKSGHISRNCPNLAKGKSKGKAAKGSYYGGKASWSQPSNSIKTLCALVEKPRAQEDLEGFVRATKTVKPLVCSPIMSLECKTMLFPSKVETNKEQSLGKTEHDFRKNRKFRKNGETLEKTKHFLKDKRNGVGNKETTKRGMRKRRKDRNTTTLSPKTKVMTKNGFR